MTTYHMIPPTPERVAATEKKIAAGEAIRAKDLVVGMRILLKIREYPQPWAEDKPAHDEVVTIKRIDPLKHIEPNGPELDIEIEETIDMGPISASSLFVTHGQRAYEMVP
jgi:hypothetical protein